MSTRQARELILRAAERMIAEGGADVPLRDIALAAGQRNNSAVQYHFGSREGLIKAIVERPLDVSETHRLRLLAEHEAAGLDDTVESLVRILVLPTFSATAEGTTGYYARFLERVRDHPAVIDQFQRSDHFSLFIVMTRLDRALTHLPEDERRRRLTSLRTVLFSLGADYERERAAGGGDADELSAERFTDQIVRMLEGLLSAPPAPTE